jgi:hypothetical protein
MKILIFSILLFININLYSQSKITKFEDFPKEILEQIDKMGIDDNPILTKIEADYFNVLLKNIKNNFNFEKKKIAFFSGGLGKVIINKKIYFENEQINLQRNNQPTFVFLYIFNESQKKITKGYDAVIFTNGKKRVSIENVIDTLTKNKK